MGINFQASDDPGTLISFPDLILQKISGLAAFYGWPEKTSSKQSVSSSTVDLWTKVVMAPTPRQMVWKVKRDIYRKRGLWEKSVKL